MSRLEPEIVEQSCKMRVQIGRYVDSAKMQREYPEFRLRDGHTQHARGAKNSFVVFVDVPDDEYENPEPVRVQFFFNGSAAIMSDCKSRALAAWRKIEPAVLACPSEHPNALGLSEKLAVYEYWKLVQAGAVGAYTITEQDMESIERFRAAEEKQSKRQKEA